MNRSLALGAVSLVAIVLSGCDSTSPLAPTPNPSTIAAAQTPPRGDGVIAVAGTVYDRAWRAVLDARIEVLDGPHAGLSARVDARGAFQLGGVFDAATRFRATAADYQEQILRLPERCAACNPNYWIHFSLETSTPAADLSGEYLLTFQADAACTQLPEELRSRTYTATLAPSAANRAGLFALSLRDARFVPRYDQVSFGVAGDYFAVPLGDGHGTPGIAEEVAPNRYLSFEGTAGGSLVASESGVLSAALDGVISCCELSAPPSGYFQCAWDTPLVRRQCTSSRHEVRLQRLDSTHR
jgi:hypothetical protein